MTTKRDKIFASGLLTKYSLHNESLHSLSRPRTRRASQPPRLWVQTEEHRGVVYHVIGTINNGAMQYETKPTHIHPSKSITFVSMHELGRGASHDLQRMDEGCWDNCAPAMRLCDDELLYPGVPLRRCQKWAAEAIELLQKGGRGCVWSDCTVYGRSLSFECGSGPRNDQLKYSAIHLLMYEKSL